MEIDNRQSINTRRKNFNSCKNCFRRFDELIMKPVFIHQYDREIFKKKAEFREILTKEVKVLEEAHVNEEYDPQENGKYGGFGILNTITNIARRQSLMRKSVLSIQSPDNIFNQRLSYGNFGTLIPTDNNFLNIGEEKISYSIPTSGLKDKISHNRKKA